MLSSCNSRIDVPRQQKPENDSNAIQYQKELEEIKESGLYKNERIILTPQGANIKVKGEEEGFNFIKNVKIVPDFSATE